MSYILDALKKAERDRHQSRVPNLATYHVVPARKERPLWPWIIAAVVLANAVVVGAFVVRDRALVARQAVVASAPARSPRAAAPRTAPVRAPAVPVAVAPTVVSRAPRVAVTETMRRRDGRDAGAARARAERGDARARIAEAEPAPPAGSRSVSARDMKLEVLIYSDDPGGRAAYIDGRRYVEGGRTPSGYVVAQIRRDGVLLRGDGREFVLRQH